MFNAPANGGVRLPLWGTARLENAGRPVRARQKGLAILYYLALEGPTSREVLADLLWGHTQALRNLRVELHHLRELLRGNFGPCLPSGEDPVRLPDFLALDPEVRPGLPLSGLEDLSEGFDAWLDGQRSRLTTRQGPIPERSDLVRQVAAGLEPPALVILNGQPWSGRTTFVRNLAHALGRPLLEGLQANGKSLRYLQSPYPEGAEARILQDRESIWVVERPAFGEDPGLILALLESYPVERTREVHLGPLSWREARDGLLRNRAFPEAASLYLTTAGNVGHLAELLAAGSAVFGASPGRRTHAVFMREARHLSLEARLALERLTVHPGALPTGLTTALEADQHLDELERKGWLVFAPEARLVDEGTRRAVYAGLQPGRRQRYHLTAAAFFREHGQVLAEAHHTLVAGCQPEWDRLLSSLGGWERHAINALLHKDDRVSVLAPTRLAVGREYAPLETSRSGPGVAGDTGRTSIVRNPLDAEESAIEWDLPRDARLVHLRGRAFLGNPLGAGLHPGTYPLRLTASGADAGLTLAPVPLPTVIASAPVLPLGEEFQYWVLLPSGSRVRLASTAGSAVLEVELSAFSPATLQGSDSALVDAYEVTPRAQLLNA